MDTFGKWLRTKIAEQPSTALAFSQKIGVTESTLHRWFKQQSPKVREYNITRIAIALGIDRDEVVRQINTHTPPGRPGTDGASSPPQHVSPRTAGALKTTGEGRTR